MEDYVRNQMILEDLHQKYPNLHVHWMRAQLPDGYIDWVYSVPNTDDEVFLAEDGCAYDKKDLRFVDYDIVKITPRESYMIMDAISYAMDMLPNHEDLYCNYTKEELGKLAQRFGDLNLKNQW